jgi:hypothetical protein
MRLPALLAALVTACAPGEAPEASSGAESPAGACALTVSFGSYAMGIDRRAYDRVRAILRDPAVRSVQERGWGREGEVSLCVAAAPADADRLFERVAAALPAKPHGPITVATAAGRRVQAPAR